MQPCGPQIIRVLAGNLEFMAYEGVRLGVNEVHPAPVSDP